MRSETPPFWSGFLVGIGIMLLVLPFIWMATGKIKLKRDSYVVREESPETFWMIIGGCFVISLVALVIAVPHFHPGG
jgi:NADH:ubiquinone oxidoreductase subunit 2 (subunit N)